MSERKGKVERATGETAVAVSIDLDGSGVAKVATGVAFLDHMLTALAKHGLFDLEAQAKGDLAVDEHHTVEDVAICLGRALNAALGERRGIVRIGHSYAPLDEALARVVVDLSGRGYCVFAASFDNPRVGQLETDMVRHFFETVAIEGRLNLHAEVLHGQNDHHKVEALFKALARALGMATRIDQRQAGSVPSTKGALDRGG